MYSIYGFLSRNFHILTGGSCCQINLCEIACETFILIETNYRCLNFRFFFAMVLGLNFCIIYLILYFTDNINS